jgi:hypothetical protein
MARLNQGFLGNASGKLGSVVFSRWRDLYTARQYQPEIHDANSAAQQKQRSRMFSLLQFLKPLNKSFIKHFNTPFCVRSTPWAKAIKDNMSIVSPEGCIPLKKFSLGDPRYKSPEIISATYNPFIDQIQISFHPDSLPMPPVPFPYNATSVLGKYKSSGNDPSFDVRHLMCCQPEGSWNCLLSEEMEQSFYLNWWDCGRLWLLLDEERNWNISSNPFRNISAPAYFEAVPLLEGFNTKVKDNLVPVNAIIWEYKQAVNNWYLDFKIDFHKTKLKNPAEFTLIMWLVSFSDNQNQFSGPYEWDLQESTFEIILGENGLQGSAICLYSIFNNRGVQVSRFNRFYINKGSDENTYPFFDQLFLCDYSHPSSFLLSGDQCGFCGNIVDMFEEIIKLYQQGIIRDDEDMPVPRKIILRMNDSPDGSVEVSGMESADGEDFFFHENSRAGLVPKPGEGFVFSNWDGEDKDDVIDHGDHNYEIPMHKDRHLQPVFIGR